VADVSNTDAFSSVWPDDLQSTTYEDFLPSAVEKAAGDEGCALRSACKIEHSAYCRRVKTVKSSSKNAEEPR
jgi:hypothetical protein